MPGTPAAGNELDDVAVAANEEVCRDPDVPDGLEVGMGIPVQCAGEQRCHRIAYEVTRRKTDVVNDDQADIRFIGSEITVGGSDITNPVSHAMG